MLLRRSTLYVLALTVGVSGALTLLYLRGEAALSPLASFAGDDAPPAAIVDDEPLLAGGSKVLGETDAEFGILPIDLGSPIENDMVEEDGIAFVPERPDGVEFPAPPFPTPTPATDDDDDDDAPLPPHAPPKAGPGAPATATFPYAFGSPQLASRLAAFLGRPVLSHAAALKADVKACPLAVHDLQVNPDQLRGERDSWKAVDEAEIRSRRAGLVKALESAEQQGEKIVGDPKAKSGGRGIVIAGGNRVRRALFALDMSPGACLVLDLAADADAPPLLRRQDTTARIRALLHILRNHHKSTLPVQIFHFAGEITDGNERKELEDLGAELVQFEGVQQLNIWKVRPPAPDGHRTRARD